MNLKEILKNVKSTPDYCYVEFEDVNDSNLLGNNALHCVVTWGEIELVETLLKNGVDVNKQGELGFTPLHCAIEHKHHEIVELLLQHGADPQIRSHGENAISLASLLEDEIAIRVIKSSKKEWRSEEDRRLDSHIEAMKLWITK